MSTTKPNILLTGATGFIGGRLLTALDGQGYRVRSLQRSLGKTRFRFILKNEPEVVQGDLLKQETLVPALEGIEVAFYLVHSMSGRKISEAQEFAARDRIAARNFAGAAGKAGLKRIIYLSGLGDLGSSLSRHLESRQEVGEILSSGNVPTTVLRSAIIIGAGGASFEMIRNLVEKMPVILCPPMINTRSQPIAVENAIQYLAGCLRQPATIGETFDVGGPEVLTYKDLIKIYARFRGLKRRFVQVPLASTRLFAKGMDIISPLPAGIVAPLLEGLKNETVCREHRIRQLVPVELIDMEEAVRKAAVEEADVFRPGLFRHRR